MTLQQNEEFAFEPIKILLVDIDSPLPDLSRQRKSGLDEYSRALVLVRLHTHSIGTIELEIPEHGLRAEELASQIWQNLEEPIRKHLNEDNLLPFDPLQEIGLVYKSQPNCLQERSDLLSPAPHVSVVIATRDRIESLAECLQSILDLDYPSFDVIIVDNAPETDATETFVKSTYGNSNQVHYLREEIPGLANAHNRALSELTAPIVAFTDDDVVVDRHWLKAIVSNFQRDPKVACVTGMILPYEIETPSQLWIEQFGGFGKGCQRINFDMLENRPQNFLFPYSAGQFGSGANMSFRTSALCAIGGFDPALGAGTLAKGGDDLAVFFDVVTNGYRLVYEPSAVLHHKHRREYSGLANQAYGYGVGLSAYLMRTIINNPKCLMDVLVKIPAGLKHILDPRSPKNKKKESGYPQELTRLELKGFIKGPLAYLQSRWQSRRVDMSYLMSKKTSEVKNVTPFS